MIRMLPRPTTEPASNTRRRRRASGEEAVRSLSSSRTQYRATKEMLDHMKNGVTNRSMRSTRGSREMSYQPLYSETKAAITPAPVKAITNHFSKGTHLSRRDRSGNSKPKRNNAGGAKKLTARCQYSRSASQPGIHQRNAPGLNACGYVKRIRMNQALGSNGRVNATRTPSARQKSGDHEHHHQDKNMIRHRGPDWRVLH